MSPRASTTSSPSTTSARDPARLLLRAARAVGLRQDDHAADDRRLRGAGRGRDLPRRPVRDRAARRTSGTSTPSSRATRSSRTCTIFENVAFGLRRRGLKGSQLDGRVREILELVDLAGRRAAQAASALRRPAAARRARARAREQPQVLLLDEPLGALDLKLRKQMQLELKALQHDMGMTFVHVTHDQEEAMTMADQIAVMNKGRIEQLGTPTELYEKPRTAFVAKLPRRLEPAAGNRRRARAWSASTAAARCDPPASLPESGSRVAVGIRPEKLAFGAGRRQPDRRHRHRERLRRRRHPVHRRHGRPAASPSTSRTQSPAPTPSPQGSPSSSASTRKPPSSSTTPRRSSP